MNDFRRSLRISDQKFGWVAVVVMAVLAVYAIVFVLERMLFLDAPFMLSNIINSGSPRIMEHRYGSVITQIWPWMGMKAGLPLIWLMHLYNGAFNVFYLVVVCLLVFRWRAYGAAVLMALYYTAMSDQAFFWTNNEIHQAVAWFFVWYGFYLYQRKRAGLRRKRFIWFGMTATIAAVTHPLMVPVLAFTWIFLLMTEGRQTGDGKVRVGLTMMIVMACCIRIWFSLRAGWYDRDKVETVKTNLLSGITEVFDKPLAAQLLHQYSHGLIVGAVLGLAGLFLLMVRRKYLLSLMYLLVIVSYHLLFLSAFDTWVDFYSQSEMMPLTIIYGLPVVRFLPEYIGSRLLFSITVMVFLIRLIMIPVASVPFTKRVSNTMSLIREMKEKNITKALIPDNKDLESIYIMTWGLPIETVLASAISGDRQRTVKPLPADKLEEAVQTPSDQFLDCFRIIPINTMNPYYFNLDSVGRYEVVRQ